MVTLRTSYDEVSDEFCNKTQAYLLDTSQRKVGCTESLYKDLVGLPKRLSNVSTNPAG